MLFDTKLACLMLSHMGEIEVTGKDASQFVQYLLSNDTDNLTTSKALYIA